MGYLGAVFLINNQAASLVRLEIDVVETKTSGVRTTSDSNEDDISVKL
jgi:hypothetical protein